MAGYETEVSMTCPRHGEYLAKQWALPGGGVIKSPCPGCRDEAVAAEMAAKDSARAFNFKIAMIAAGLGVRYHQASFENYLVRIPEEAMVLEAVRSYAESFDRKHSPNLVMYGNTGTGKTHLACAMTRYLLQRDVTVLYLPILTLFSQYQDIVSYRGEHDGSREEFFAKLRAPDLLIVDEFGITTLKESERIVLHRVIDERYNSQAPICIIGNTNLDELQKEVGERAMRRVMANADVVMFEFNGLINVNGDLFQEGGGK